MSRSLAALLVIAASPLAAQDLARLAARIDSTHAAAIAARDSLQAYRRANPSVFHFSDSAVIANGMIRVYFDAALAPLARAGAEEADRLLSEAGEARARLERAVYTIVPDTALTPFDRRDVRGRVDVRHHRNGVVANPNHNSTVADPKAIASMMVWQAEGKLAFSAGPAFVRWQRGGLPLTPEARDRVDWGWVRLDMVSSPSHLGRTCYEGDLRACRVFLGLDSITDPLKTWYDSAGRRRVVATDLDKSTSGSRVATPRCLEGDDQACITVLERLRHDMDPPANHNARQSLVARALALGGERAVERLVLSTGSVGDALAAAARQPIDSVVADWQRHVRGRSGPSTNLPPTIVLASLVWIAACFFLAFRSSRWR